MLKKGCFSLPKRSTPWLWEGKCQAALSSDRKVEAMDLPSLLPVPERLLTRSSQFKEGLHHTIVVPGLGGLFLMPSPGALSGVPLRPSKSRLLWSVLMFLVERGSSLFTCCNPAVWWVVLFLFSLVHQPFRRSKLVFSPLPCPLEVSFFLFLYYLHLEIVLLFALLSLSSLSPPFPQTLTGLQGLTVLSSQQENSTLSSNK